MKDFKKLRKPSLLHQRALLLAGVLISIGCANGSPLPCSRRVLFLLSDSAFASANSL